MHLLGLYKFIKGQHGILVYKDEKRVREKSAVTVWCNEGLNSLLATGNESSASSFCPAHYCVTLVPTYCIHKNVQTVYSAAELRKRYHI